MKRLLHIAALLLLLTACQKEIDINYHDVSPVVTIEGRITNEQTYVLITRTRSMEDSVKSRGISGATVLISSDSLSEQLVYDARTGCYQSPSGLKGVPGRTYHLTVKLDGQQYEATSTMPQPAPIISAEFVRQPMLDNEILMYEMWAVDPEPDARNYFWYRMDRYAQAPQVRLEQGEDPYRWNTFDDRGSLVGRIYRDIICVDEEMLNGAEDIEEDFLKTILFDGDTIALQLMAIDRPTFEYYQSLGVGQRMGANPISNITGGCLGYFTAGCVTHADTVVYRSKNLKQKY